MYAKKKILFTALMFLTLSVHSQSMTIDEAIRTTAVEIGQKIGNGNQIAVLNFSSQWHRLSAYVVDEMNNAIVREGSLTVVERQRLELARQELNLNMSGEVSDDSAQRIGYFLGAQSVLTGTFSVIGGTYRFRIHVITVETGAISYSNSITVRNDNILSSLIPKANYTWLERLGIGLLNIPFGAGSFMFDPYPEWGWIILGLELGGAFIGFSVGAIAGANYDNALELMGIGTIIGFGVGAIIGVGRAFFIPNPSSGMAFSLPIDINLVSDSASNAEIQILYRLSL